MVTCFDAYKILEMLSEASIKAFLGCNGLYDRQPYCLE